MSSTSLGAGKGKTHTITFKSKEHENFYSKYLPKCRYHDENYTVFFHQYQDSVFFYTGISMAFSY